MSRNTSIYLDLLRFTAAVCVFLAHCRRFVDPDLSKLLASHSSEAVAVFFVLSGFMIRQVTKTRETSALSYAISRLARLSSVVLPAIAVTLIADRLGLLINPGYYTGLEFWNGPANIQEVIVSAFFLNEVWGQHGVMGTNEPFWSLGYEVPYYLLFATLYLPGWISRIVAAGLWAVFYGPFVAAYALLWFLGVVLNDLLQKWDRDKQNPPWVVLCCLAPLLYPLLKYVIFPPAGALMRVENPGQYLGNFFYYIAIGLLFAAHVYGFARLMDGRRIFSPAAETSIRWLAGACFTIYLMHQPILVFLGALDQIHGSALTRGPGAIILAFLVLLLLAEAGERRKSRVRHWIAGTAAMRATTVKMRAGGAKNDR